MKDISQMTENQMASINIFVIFFAALIGKAFQLGYSWPAASPFSTELKSEVKIEASSFSMVPRYQHQERDSTI